MINTILAIAILTVLIIITIQILFVLLIFRKIGEFANALYNTMKKYNIISSDSNGLYAGDIRGVNSLSEDIAKIIVTEDKNSEVKSEDPIVKKKKSTKTD